MANTEDLDQTLGSAASDLGLHFLSSLSAKIFCVNSRPLLRTIVSRDVNAHFQQVLATELYNN